MPTLTKLREISKCIEVSPMMPTNVLLFVVVLCNERYCNVMLHYVMLCYVMLCKCHVLSCHVVLYCRLI